MFGNIFKISKTFGRPWPLPVFFVFSKRTNIISVHLSPISERRPALDSVSPELKLPFLTFFLFGLHFETKANSKGLLMQKLRS